GIQAKVLDFGVAKSLRVEGHLTQTGTIVGTPAYMSPEQVRGEAVDARSDLYSLAAVLHEALSGRRLVPEGDLARTFAVVLKAPPRPLAGTVAGIPTGVDALLGRALAKRPEDRPADVLSWAEELAALLDSVPAGEPSVPGWPEPVVVRRPRPRPQFEMR
ncbi:serine/threonine protein kinase, partial [Acidobacteria bacterium ACD]|nr:serine/threonine protein kinase [Acidobacteria bacterium ACD]